MCDNVARHHQDADPDDDAATIYYISDAENEAEAVDDAAVATAVADIAALRQQVLQASIISSYSPRE